MARGVYLRCWTVFCKTKDCGLPLFLDVIGPKGDFRHAVTPTFHPFSVTCPKCNTANIYGPFDLTEQNLEDPPQDYRCREFLDALHKASEPRESGAK